MKSKRIISTICVALVAVTVFVFLYFDSLNQFKSESQFAMDTVMTYKLYGKNSNKTISELKEYVLNLDNKLSLYSESSEIHKINQNAGKDYVKVSGDTFELLTLSKQLCQNSKGSIDLTVAPVMKLWGFATPTPKVPTSQDIESVRNLVNYSDLLLDNSNCSVKLQNIGQAIDLGGFAKGYVCEKAVKICKDNGVKKAVIAIGGNIAIIGDEVEVGVRVPQINSSGYFITVKIKDSIIATSGGYERYFKENGKIYEHIINPSTCAPVESDLLSVSVISQNGILTDALSTQLYVQGLESVKEMLNDTTVGIIAVDKNKTVYVSNHLKGLVSLNKEFPDYHFAE
jgi:thiamine biosynthesis lipoprotein